MRSNREFTVPSFAASLVLLMQSVTAPTANDAGAIAEPGGFRHITLGLELRNRAELTDTFFSEETNRLLLPRVRLNAAFRPTSAVRFVIQAQDVRSICLRSGSLRSDLSDPFDLRLAYFAVGHSEQGFELRAGRQELSVGDERLLGADSYWDWFGPVYDAVGFHYARGALRAQAFVGQRVVPSTRQPDRSDRHNRIAGAVMSWTTRGQRLIEPYLILRSAPGVEEVPSERQTFSPGFRAQGPFLGSGDYNVEMVLQRGRVGFNRVSAWAGHWEGGWKPLGAEFKLRLWAELNYASGDRDPGDRVSGTFDDLCPAGFNRFGIEDPIAWRNALYPGAGAEMPLSGRLTMFAGFQRHWLATVQDGLYPGGEGYLARNPSAGSRVGDQTALSIAFEQSRHWRVLAGFGVLWPGPFLRNTGYKRPLASAYLVTSFQY